MIHSHRFFPQIDRQGTLEAAKAALPEIFRAAWGEPERPGATEWRPKKPGQSGSDPRRMILRGPRAGLWHDAASGQGGDLLSFWANHIGRDVKSDFRSVLESLAGFVGYAGRITDPAEEARRERARAARRRLEAREAEMRAARAAATTGEALAAMRRVAVPLSDSRAEPARAYFAGRGLGLPDHPDIGFLPAGALTGVRGLRAPLAPALVLFGRDAAGALRAAQRITLRADGSDRDREIGKLYTGPASSYPVRLSARPGDATGGALSLAEGFESALAVWTATGGEVLACLDAGGLAKAIARAPEDRRVLVWSDRDAEGSPARRQIDRACEALALRHSEAARVIASAALVPVPAADAAGKVKDGADAADVLARHGAAGVLAMLREAAAITPPAGAPERLWMRRGAETWEERQEALARQEAALRKAVAEGAETARVNLAAKREREAIRAEAQALAQSESFKAPSFPEGKRGLGEKGELPKEDSGQENSGENVLTDTHPLSPQTPLSPSHREGERGAFKTGAAYRRALKSALAARGLKRLPRPTPHAPATLFTGAAGTGKTKTTLEALAASGAGVVTLYAAPNHLKAAEAREDYARLNAGPPSLLWRGRSAPRPDDPAARMCAQHVKAEAYAAAGGNVRGKMCLSCPVQAQCAYLQQEREAQALAAADAGLVLFGAHAALFAPGGGRPIPDLVILDEDARGASYREQAVDLEALILPETLKGLDEEEAARFAAARALGAPLLAGLRAVLLEAPESPAPRLAALAPPEAWITAGRALEALRLAPKVSLLLDGEAFLAALRRAALPPLGLMGAALRRVGERLRDRPEEGSIAGLALQSGQDAAARATWRRLLFGSFAMARLADHVPVIALDATGDAEIWRRVLRRPGARLKRHHVPIERHAEIVQVARRTFPKSAFRLKAAGDESAEEEQISKAPSFPKGKEGVGEEWGTSEGTSLNSQKSLRDSHPLSPQTPLSPSLWEGERGF